MMNHEGGDLDSAIARNMDDVRSLENQIRNLLKTLELVHDLGTVDTLVLPEEKVSNTEPAPPEVKLRWVEPDETNKKKRRVKMTSDPGDHTSRIPPLNEHKLDELEKMEVCIKEQEELYCPVENSVFFVPVLDRCIFGMTLLNVTSNKLRMPFVTLDLQPSEDGRRKKRSGSFLYDLDILLKNVLPSGPGTFHDGLATDQVMPGCGVLITANFACTPQILEWRNNFTILVSVFLDGTQLWTRRVLINERHFQAASVDFAFKNNHINIITALGTERESFSVGRTIMSNEEKVPQKSILRFLIPLGYENITSVAERTGIDTSTEVYTTMQPSFLWGTSFRLEKCSRNPNLLRCAVTTRTKDQMQFLFSKLQDWLKEENRRDRKLGMKGLTIVPSCPQDSISICDGIQAEIQLVQQINQVKTVLFGDDRISGRSQKWKSSRRSETPSIDSTWIHEYSISVSKTDSLFNEKM